MGPDQVGSINDNILYEQTFVSRQVDSFNETFSCILFGFLTYENHRSLELHTNSLFKLFKFLLAYVHISDVDLILEVTVAKGRPLRGTPQMIS